MKEISYLTLSVCDQNIQVFVFLLYDMAMEHVQ